MPEQEQPTYAELVREVIKGSSTPLTFQQVFDGVSSRRPVTTKNPQITIRNALNQMRTVVRTDELDYAYLPNMVTGVVVRLPLAGDFIADCPVTVPDELIVILWPDCGETGKHLTLRPLQARLPDGQVVEVSLDSIRSGKRGAPFPDGLRRYLTNSLATVGDSLQVRVVDGVTGACEAWHEPKWTRNETAIQRRNQELADAAYRMVLAGTTRGAHMSWLIMELLLRGFFHSLIASDRLPTILADDVRFVYAGFDVWVAAPLATGETRIQISERTRIEAEVLKLLGITPDEIAGGLGARSSIARGLYGLSPLTETGDEATNQLIHSVFDIFDGRKVTITDPERALDLAQDLIYDAWEVPTDREAVSLARKALDLSPICADAYVLLAKLTAKTHEEAASLYAQGMAAGERALGKELFKEYRGHFWGFLETRPYMRARSGLAIELRALGHKEEANAHLRAMLRLNKNDNQGIRYLLLSWLIDDGDDVAARKLLRTSPGDCSPEWLWGETLLSYRSEGDTVRTRKLLARAMRGNRFVLEYLLGTTRLPRYQPDSYILGSEGEAICYAFAQRNAWRQSPGAIKWLKRFANDKGSHLGTTNGGDACGDKTD